MGNFFNKFRKINKPTDVLSFPNERPLFYEKKIRLTLSIEENLNNLSSSNKHSDVFKRTISRLFEMTKSP